MRIAFAGASGTGKTTLAKRLEAELGIPWNPVGSRSTAKGMGFDTPYEVDSASMEVYMRGMAAHGDPRRSAHNARREYVEGMETVRALFQRQLRQNKLDWERERDTFVTCRSVLDDLAYTVLHCPENVTPAFIEEAMLHMQQYDIVVFCPISAFHTHSGDPARLDDLMYHRRYEWLLRGMLAEWNRGADAAYIELHNEGIESRLEILLPLAGLG